ncbi:DUF4199 domain-containing protein [Flavobacterium sp. PLA-1-15]|uniref:DUF4199 domain-containing protein n=1 Tax=Flavobacterium sp. PLA-1-15 TaxID=3380533 RepID=UPI003B7CCE0D
MTDIIKKTGFSIGLILGILLILLSSYIYFVNLALLTNVWAGVSTLALTIIFGIISIVVIKGKLGGFITFKEAFSGYFITILTGSLLSCLYLILIYNFALSPEIKTNIVLAMRNFDVNLLKQNLMPQENINQTLEFYKTFDPFTIKEVITAFIKYLLRDCLIGFLVALIFRNKRNL